MRITLPVLDRSNPLVAELLDKSRAATTLGEGAYFQRLARKATEKTA